jgi:hypothetical protein
MIILIERPHSLARNGSIIADDHRRAPVQSTGPA